MIGVVSGAGTVPTWQRSRLNLCEDAKMANTIQLPASPLTLATHSSALGVRKGLPSSGPVQHAATPRQRTAATSSSAGSHARHSMDAGSETEHQDARTNKGARSQPHPVHAPAASNARMGASQQRMRSAAAGEQAARQQRMASPGEAHGHAHASSSAGSNVSLEDDLCQVGASSSMEFFAPGNRAAPHNSLCGSHTQLSFPFSSGMLELFGCYRLTGPATLVKRGPYSLQAYMGEGSKVELLSYEPAHTTTISQAMMTDLLSSYATLDEAEMGPAAGAPLSPPSPAPPPASQASAAGAAAEAAADPAGAPLSPPSAAWEAADAAEAAAGGSSGSSKGASGSGASSGGPGSSGGSAADAAGGIGGQAGSSIGAGARHSGGASGGVGAAGASASSVWPSCLLMAQHVEVHGECCIIHGNTRCAHERAGSLVLTVDALAPDACVLLGKGGMLLHPVNAQPQQRTPRPAQPAQQQPGSAPAAAAELAQQPAASAAAAAPAAAPAPAAGSAPPAEPAQHQPASAAAGKSPGPAGAVGDGAPRQ